VSGCTVHVLNLCYRLKQLRLHRLHSSTQQNTNIADISRSWSHIFRSCIFHACTLLVLAFVHENDTVNARRVSVGSRLTSLCHSQCVTVLVGHIGVVDSFIRSICGLQHCLVGKMFSSL